MVLLVVLPGLLLVWAVWKMLYMAWWKPLRIQRWLRKQGIHGPSYQLFFGNTRETMSRFYDIALRVLAYLYHVAKEYENGTAGGIAWLASCMGSVEGAVHGKVSVVWYGSTPVVLVASPELAEEILANKSGHFLKTPPPSILEGMVPTFSFSNSELLKTWEKLTAISGSCELDVFAEMQTLNEIKTSKMLFGKDQKKGKRLFHIQKEQAKRGFQDLWKMRLPGFRFIPTEGSLRMKKPNQEATIILQDIIRKRIEEMNTEDARNDDVLTLLLEAYMIDNDPNEPESFKKVGISMDARLVKLFLSKSPHFSFQQQESHRSGQQAGFTEASSYKYKSHREACVASHSLYKWRTPPRRCPLLSSFGLLLTGSSDQLLRENGSISYLSSAALLFCSSVLGGEVGLLTVVQTMEGGSIPEAARRPWPPYKLFVGNVMEDVGMAKQAWTKPMDMSHAIVPRVTPFSAEMQKKYGKMFLLWSGASPVVTITDPEMVKDILTNKFGHFGKPPVHPLLKFVALGITTLEGEQWATRRKIINPAFYLDKLKGMTPAFVASCEQLIKRWENAASAQGSCELNVWEELQALTSDVISRTAFGSSYEEGKQIFNTQKEQMKLLLDAVTSIFIPGLRYLPTRKNMKIWRLHKEVTSMLRTMIDKREEEIKLGIARDDDLLGLLLKSNKNDDDYELHDNNHGIKKEGMTKDEIIEECKLFYFAGQESTSVLLTWTMILLSMHPEWQSRARDEVFEVCGNKTPTFDSLSHLKTVTMILYEVLRLYPPFFINVRYICKPVKLGDVTFPEGVQLLMPILGIHHDHDTWGNDADEFQPQRFSNGISSASKHQLAFFPFGWGPRICLGQSFALIEAKMALSMILQRFSFKLSPAYVHAPWTVVTLQPQHGAPIIFHPI
ncbi:cytochrome P450 CYP72A219-like [Nymphaea colorata]|nr:cytochrome P450 CYP72A219-like [Nymphaea colorata]